MMQETEKYYREVEYPRVLASIKKWEEEFPLEWRKERRKEYLLNKLEVARDAFFQGCKDLAKREDDLTYWSVKYLEGLERQLNKVSFEIQIFTGKAEGISSEKITQAVQYPLANFMKDRRGMAKCPFHNDKTPSLDIRKNFYYCYGCGAHGNVINYVMRT